MPAPFLRQLFLAATLLLLLIARPSAAQQTMITAGFQLPLPLPSVGVSHAFNGWLAVGAGLHLVPVDETLLTGAYTEIRFIPSGAGFNAFYLSGNFSWIGGADSSTHMLGSVLAGWQWPLSKKVGAGLAGGVGAWYDSRWQERDPRSRLGDGPVIGLPFARFEIGVVL